ncbi:LuxR C-terminal-related transcriptional regulator [Parapedobacter soli]|uniref:LuxR C-terminal-related transcriptional regulator n=1 Tax=Parapedobacter soli TaxID=416955 RepID=UPI0021C75646|nr:LuxR C-terminal-related transcriptional regulator [Parapedobacter soli]
MMHLNKNTESLAFDQIKQIWRRIAKTKKSAGIIHELEFYKKLVDVLHVGKYYVYIFNCSSVEMEFVHENVTQVLGYQPVDVTPEIILKNIHPEDLPYFINFEDTVGVFFNQLPKDKIFKYKVSYDYRLKNANGEYTQILQQVTTIQTSEEQGILRTLGVHTDISHIKMGGTPKLSFIGLDGEPSYHNVNSSVVFLPSKPLLTKREMEILKLIVEGQSSDAIAVNLFISRHTVDTHRRNILAKTETKSLAELITKAIKEGWV